MRGEDEIWGLGLEHVDGAPLRAWGGRHTPSRSIEHLRSTPTCVGRTWARTPRPLHRGGHRRSTPTCVGRTRIPEHSQRGRAEHPHVRGEDWTWTPRSPSRGGAPPRAWGGLTRAAASTVHPRSTPTCVGRTAFARPSRRQSAEHPHVRGEDVASSGSSPTYSGAPPRAWGGRHGGPPQGHPHRSTPTCVGRTQGWPGPACSRPEHPHVRGEDIPRCPLYCPSSGAPPSAWGGRGDVARDGHVERSTPTCVGRTPRSRWRFRRTAEHPHVRGEDASSPKPTAGRRGAPPRAWGGHGEQLLVLRVERSTPTCVGRTPR